MAVDTCGKKLGFEEYIATACNSQVLTLLAAAPSFSRFCLAWIKPYTWVHHPDPSGNYIISWNYLSSALSSDQPDSIIRWVQALMLTAWSLALLASFVDSRHSAHMRTV